MKKLFKTEGLVLRKTRLNEADQIITLLTPELGPLDCFLKGCRRIKSKFCGKTELFYRLSITAFRGERLSHINEIEVLSYSVFEKNDVLSHGAAFYVTELTRKLLPQGEPAEEVYAILKEVINLLTLERKPEIILQAYTIKLLTFLGFMAPWNRCNHSGKKLFPEDPIYFRGSEGSLLSERYAVSDDQLLSLPLIKWIHFMQRASFPEILRVCPSPEEHQKTHEFVLGLTENLMGYPLKSGLFLQKIRSGAY